MYNMLSPQTIPVEAEPKFQALAPPSKKLWLRLQPFKIAWAPAPQPCLKLTRQNYNHVLTQEFH